MKKFIREFLAFKWYLQESNRGHTDFQSDALPTELRHHCFCGAKILLFCESCKFLAKNFLFTGKSSNFAFAFQSNRDVAQLVAHYVRDVGVGRSSRLIPTKTRRGTEWF